MQTLICAMPPPHVEDLFSSTLAFSETGGGRGFKKISFKSMNSSKDEKWLQVVAVVVVVVADVVADVDAVVIRLVANLLMVPGRPLFKNRRNFQGQSRDPVVVSIELLSSSGAPLYKEMFLWCHA